MLRPWANARGSMNSLEGLAVRLDDSQRAAIHLQRCWGKLQPSDGGEDVEEWWGKIRRPTPHPWNSANEPWSMRIRRPRSGAMKPRLR